MKPVGRMNLLEFELFVEDFAAEFAVETKEDLEWFSSLLHNHLENAISDRATDLGIEDYEPQY